MENSLWTPYFLHNQYKIQTLLLSEPKKTNQKNQLKYQNQSKKTQKKPKTKNLKNLKFLTQNEKTACKVKWCILTNKLLKQLEIIFKF